MQSALTSFVIALVLAAAAVAVRQLRLRARTAATKRTPMLAILICFVVPVGLGVAMRAGFIPTNAVNFTMWFGSMLYFVVIQFGRIIADRRR